MVAVGDCGCTGGIFGESYASCGRVANVIPVDVAVPGCRRRRSRSCAGFSAPSGNGRRSPANARLVARERLHPHVAYWRGQRQRLPAAAMICAAFGKMEMLFGPSGASICIQPMHPAASTRKCPTSWVAWPAKIAWSASSSPLPRSRCLRHAMSLAAFLVPHVEDVLERRVGLEQPLVEALDDGVAVLGENRRGGLDGSDGGWIEHLRSLAL